jgi:hypothetical protein
MMKNIFPASVWCLICLIALPQMAHAASVSFPYEGIVTRQSGLSTADDFEPFDVLTGTNVRFEFSFDGEASDGDSSPNIGLYPLHRLVVTVGPHTFSAGNGKIHIYDSTDISPLRFGDQVHIISESVSGPKLGLFSINQARLRLGFFPSIFGPSPAPKNDVLVSDRLPVIPFAHGDFGNGEISLDFGGGFLGIGQSTIHAEGNITLAPVPLPPSLFLFASGLLGLGGLQIKRGFRF